MRRRLLLGVVLASVLAVVLSACGGDVRSGTRLTLAAEPQPAGTCPATDSLTVTLQPDGGTVAFLDPSGVPVSIIWPFGFAAWSIEGRSSLFASDGTAVLREGSPAVKIDGRQGAAGTPFRVCSIGSRSYQ